jgi:hypothetical protein
MTGYESKRAAARDKLDDTQVYQTELTKLLMESYDKGVADALAETKAALAQLAQEPWRESASDYERGFIDGMQKQMQSSVDKAVNRMAQPAQEPADDVRGFLAARLTCWHRLTEKESDELVALFEVKTQQRPWVDLTDEDINTLYWNREPFKRPTLIQLANEIITKFKEKNT